MRTTVLRQWTQALTPPERDRDKQAAANHWQRIETVACHKDGREIPVELTLASAELADRAIYLACLRDISQRKTLELELHRQPGITASILNSMASAVLVADLSGRLMLVNQAGRRLLGMEPGDSERGSLDAIVLLQPDGHTHYPDEQRPIKRALRGEQVDKFMACVRRKSQAGGCTWASITARPLHNGQGELIGGVAVFEDVTELVRREQELEAHTRRLQEQASLLDLAHDAILVRTADDVITYWNRSAEQLYGFSCAEALGQVSHILLQTRYPLPLDAVKAAVHRLHYWQGEVSQTTKDGRELMVFSQWVLDFQEGRPCRYLETNTDITQRLQTERALRQSQEDYRRLVEASTDHAIMTLDLDGNIVSWNSGAEKIFGLPAGAAIGRPVSSLFTVEDRSMGQPAHELEAARTTGAAEDNRWQLREDGSRFWATGTTTPLYGQDGSLRGFVKILRDQTAQRLEEEQTRFLANHDSLTGLPNRIHFSNRLHQSIALSQRTGLPLALLLLDLDRFKYVNDTFGHHTGDLLLKEVALRLKSSIRETDFVARLGGDEFVIIQRDVSQPDAAETLARKLILELGRPFHLEDQEIWSGASIGLCTYPQGGKNPVELLKRADLALYRAKHAGRQTYQVYTPDLGTQYNGRQGREEALRGALKNHQFELYYQPLVDLHSWKISAVEALLRWNASDMETVLPGEFLDIVEQNGLIVEIGAWALREACHQVRRWQAHGLHDLRLSVNCSARQFNDAQFVATIPSVLRETGIAPECFALEVPEAMLGQHPEIKERLSALRALGIRLAIDNFGTGSTALIDYKDFDIDMLKIDKAFVQHLPHRREDSAITAAIISLAHNLGIAVAAGGVETAEQLAYLKSRDCNSAQGFIFSPPVPAQQFEELLLSGSWSRINRVPPLRDGMTLDDMH